MKKISRPALLAAFAFSALALAIVSWLRYGLLPPASFAPSVVFFSLAALCFMVAGKVRRGKEKDKHGIGMDRSQLSPVFVANWLVVAQAAAWTGAIVGGAYTGVASFVLTHAAQLSAAHDDLAPVVLCMQGALIMAFAGLVLEKACTIDPPEAGSTGRAGTGAVN